MLIVHAGASHGLWGVWNFDPALLTGLTAGAGVYTVGIRCLWRAAGTGHGVTWWQATCYGAGIAALVIALVSPLDAFASGFDGS